MSLIKIKSALYLLVSFSSLAQVPRVRYYTDKQEAILDMKKYHGQGCKCYIYILEMYKDVLDTDKVIKGDGDTGELMPFCYGF
jgi:hypothetical protein